MLIMLMLLATLSALSVVVSMAYANDELIPRLVNMFYSGYRAIDRYVYGDVVIEVIYLNPKVYYSYRNAYVVPFNYIWGVSESLPSDVFRNIAVNVIRELRAIGVHANYVIVETYFLGGTVSNESMIVDKIESIDRVEYLIYDALKGLLTRTREFSFSNYRVILSKPSVKYLIISYVDLSESERLRVIRVIGDVVKRFNISNATIAVFDEIALNLKNSYFTDTLKFDKNETLKNMLIQAFDEAISAFMEVNASCFVGSGGIFGGYWAALDIRDTFDNCADAVKRFVHVYVDEIRRIVPEDIPIYIELRENMDPLQLLPLKNKSFPELSQELLLAIAIIIVAIPALIIMWRITRRVNKN